MYLIRSSREIERNRLVIINEVQENKKHHVPYLRSFKSSHELNYFFHVVSTKVKKEEITHTHNEWREWQFAARFKIYIIFNIYESSLHLNVCCARKLTEQKNRRDKIGI